MDYQFEKGTESQPHLREAFERIRPMMARLSRSELIPINIDPWTAVAVARSALPGLRACRPLLATLSAFEVAHLDRLEDYALGLLQAESVYRGFASRSQELSLLLKDAFALRARLVTDAIVLADRSLIGTNRLPKLNVPNGYRTIGADLLSIAAILRSNWSSIEDCTAIEPAELERAEQLGELLIGAIVVRRRPTPESAAASDDRQRAFTLFLRAYREIRRAVLYLRSREGDAEQIAPSLYRRRRKSRESDQSAATSSSHQTPPSAGSDNDDTQTPTTITDPFVH